jgi:hypothetical protein
MTRQPGVDGSQASLLRQLVLCLLSVVVGFHSRPQAKFSICQCSISLPHTWEDGPQNARQIARKRLYGTGFEGLVAYSRQLMERRSGYALKQALGSASA